MGEKKKALINVMDERREALNYLGLEFGKRAKALGYEFLGVHIRGTDTKDVMLVSLIVAEKGFDMNRKPDGMDWANEMKDYLDSHTYPWEEGEGESGSPDSFNVQD